MESEKVKEIKELLRCMNGEKACTNCYINEIAEERETFCINVVADMTLDLINELESENEKLKQHKRELQGGQQDLAKTIKEQKDRIAELEGEITNSDILNSKRNGVIPVSRVIEILKENVNGENVDCFVEVAKRVEQEVGEKNQ